MTIRTVRASDLPTVAALIRELTPDLADAEATARLETISTNKDHRIWIFERHGRIIGVLHAFKRPALEKPIEVVVQSMVVDAAHRDTGIGRALLVEVERWARETGHCSIALHTREAASFYERIGYTRIATPYLMRKILN